MRALFLSNKINNYLPLLPGIESFDLSFSGDCISIATIVFEIDSTHLRLLSRKIYPQSQSSDWKFLKLTRPEDRLLRVYFYL